MNVMRYFLPFLILFSVIITKNSCAAGSIALCNYNYLLTLDDGGTLENISMVGYLSINLDGKNYKSEMNIKIKSDKENFADIYKREYTVVHNEMVPVSLKKNHPVPSKPKLAQYLIKQALSEQENEEDIFKAIINTGINLSDFRRIHYVTFYELTEKKSSDNIIYLITAYDEYKTKMSTFILGGLFDVVQCTNSKKQIKIVNQISS